MSIKACGSLRDLGWEMDDTLEVAGTLLCLLGFVNMRESVNVNQ